MAYDALLALQAAVTKTATFNGTGVAMPYGTSRRGMAARVSYIASAATGTSTFTPSIDQTNDGTNYFTIAQANPILASTAATSIVHIPFNAAPGATKDTKFRLTMTVAGGTTPSIIYSSDVGHAWP